MELNRAIEILEEYNKWRNGYDTPMIEPSLITLALDKVIASHKRTWSVNNTKGKHIISGNGTYIPTPESLKDFSCKNYVITNFDENGNESYFSSNL